MTFLRRGALAMTSVVVVSIVSASCGGDTLGVATTVVNVTPTNFATIPPVASTLPGTTTSLPANAVGSEQVYVVKAGDSPLAVANKYSISLTALLAYNGWVSPAQFPYPGSEIKIPPQAVVRPSEPNEPDSGTSNSAAPSGPASSGCGTRPGGTYEVQSGDSLSVLVRKFCVKRATLLEANAGWVEEFAQNGNVVMYPGQTIQIPPANS
jgi:peptidoglycan endopeptidase LytE